MKKLPKLIKKVNLIIVSFHKIEFYNIYLNIYYLNKIWMIILQTG